MNRSALRSDILCMLAVLFSCIALAGCGGGSNKPKSNTTPDANPNDNWPQIVRTLYLIYPSKLMTMPTPDF